MRAGLCKPCLAINKRVPALRNSSSCRAHWQEWWSERAAIREYEGGATRADAEREAKKEAEKALGGEL